MSYEIVKSIKLEQRADNTWFATVTSADSSLRPLFNHKWTYDNKEHSYTKEELQKDILLDFYYGNFHGGKSTKYGQFMTFLGNSWGCANTNSMACNIYHKYDKIRTKLRNDYLTNDSTTGCWEFGTELYKKYCNRDSKLRLRQDRELKRYLYQEFQQFKPKCKPTIIRLWEQKSYKQWSKTDKYVLQHPKQKCMYIADFNNATKFTSVAKLEKNKRTLLDSGYKVEFIEV